MVTIGAVCLLLSGAFLGADHPSGPVHNANWPKGIDALANSPQRVHGYFVNWEDVFFFKGDSATFNKFLETYAKVPGTKKKVVIHEGNLEVRSPWDDAPRKQKADWKLYTSTLSTPQSQVDVWLSREDIKVPRDLEVQEDQRLLFEALPNSRTGLIEIVVRNFSNTPANVNLGISLGNGNAVYPTNLSLNLVEGNKTMKLPFNSIPGIGGRVDDYIVPLAPRAVYRFNVRFIDFVKYTMPQGKYKFSITLDGRAPEHVNGDMAGVKNLKVWTGVVTSDVAEIEHLWNRF